MNSADRVESVSKVVSDKFKTNVIIRYKNKALKKAKKR